MRPILDLTPDMIVRTGPKVIAHEVESKRARKAHADSAVKSIRADPMWRAVG
jgi:hypothetical protein